LRRLEPWELGTILRDAKKLVIGPAKPDPLGAAPQYEVKVYPPLKSRGVKLRSSTFHSLYLSAGSTV
jgi:hypothetical protein